MWIRLKNIQVYAFHGAFEHEREHGGRFEIDIELRADLGAAASADDLALTIDYVAVHRAAIEVCMARKHFLLESLAQELATRMLSQFPAEEAIVRVRKPGAAVGGILENVEIECRKSRS